MADDEDTFVTIGTPFDVPDEDAPKKKALPLHEQFATDTEGRRRFHGAFTGGFSAGYFNTVGSKEGWTPSNFVSSRSQRSESSRQKPEDFMDEEDLGEFGIAPRNVETTQLFSRERKRNENKKNDDDVSHDESLDSMVRVALEDLVVACRMSIGVKLLKKMGWKEGQGIGARVKQQSKKKVYGCILPAGHGGHENEENDIYAEGLLFAPKDTKPIKFVPKDDLHGFGYKGIQTSTELEIPKPGYSGSLKIKGQAFGVGAFEEDDADVYTQDSVSNYDIELHDREATDLHGWTGPPSQSGKGSLLSNFSKASQPRLANNVFHPPSIPKGYQPFASVKENEAEKSSQETTPKRSSQHLTSDERGRLLGEQPLPKTAKSVFEYMSKSDKDRIASSDNVKVTSSAASETDTSTKRFLSQTTPLGSSKFQPFPKDAAKQARYQSYLESRKTGKEVNLPKELCGGLTEWEREREKEEFSKSAMLFQPLKGSMATRFTRGSYIGEEPDNSRGESSKSVPESVPGKAADMEMFGKFTRNTFEWHPAKLLCKRFNIPEPYPSSKTVGLIQERKEKFNLGNLFKSSADSDAGTRVSDTNTSSPRPNSPSLAALVEPVQQNTAVNQDADTEATTVHVAIGTQAVSDDQGNKGKPSMDLFKAIFASSSEEESEDSESEEDVKDKGAGVNAKTQVAGATDVNLSRDVSSSSNVTSNDCQAKVTQGENNTDRDSMEVEEHVYGPQAPPPSEKSEDRPKVKFSPRKAVPFSSIVSGNDSEVSRSKAKKKHKHKHKHKQKGREKESVRETESRKEGEREKDTEREKRKESDKEKGKGDERGERGKRKEKEMSKTQDREKVEDSPKVSKKNSEGTSKPRDIPDDKEILSKLKAVQKRRMRAADFM